MSLKEYVKKRKLNISKEPKAKIKKVNSKEVRFSSEASGKIANHYQKGKLKKTGRLSLFVVQEHHARNLHFDFRLEMDGVLKSWAVPKGIPLTTGIKHLAVHVEDHPLGYEKFHGTIPEGNYGAGEVKIWDNGTYELKNKDSKKIEVILHGKKLKGNYVLVKTHFGAKPEKSWLIMKV